jgi:hypothetical protein
VIGKRRRRVQAKRKLYRGYYSATVRTFEMTSQGRRSKVLDQFRRRVVMETYVWIKSTPDSSVPDLRQHAGVLKVCRNVVCIDKAVRNTPIVQSDFRTKFRRNLANVNSCMVQTHDQ